MRRVDAGTGIAFAVLGAVLLVVISRYMLELWRDRRNPMPTHRSRYGVPISAAEELRQVWYAAAAAAFMLLGGVVIAVTSPR